MRNVTIELDIPMEILKIEEDKAIISDITRILLNKRTYSSEGLTELDQILYSDNSNDADDVIDAISARFGSDIYSNLNAKANEKIECDIAETLDSDGYLAKNIICNVGIEDPKVNKVMTKIEDDDEIEENAGESDGGSNDPKPDSKPEILSEADMKYITCEMIQMKIHPKELENLGSESKDNNGQFGLSSFNDEISTHIFKPCVESNDNDQVVDGGNQEFESAQNLYTFEIPENKTQPLHFNHHF